MHKPLVYQIVNEKQVHVDGKFILLAKNDVGFVIGDYDLSRTLIIDPVIAFSSFLGGSGADGGILSGNGFQNNMGITVDFQAR